MRLRPGPLLEAALLLASSSLACIDRAPGSGSRRERIPTAVAARYLLASVAPRIEVGAVYGGALELIGLDLEPPTLCSGRPATLTLYWRVLKEPDTRWEVFVHLDGPGVPRIHGDHWPAQGAYPTSAWRRGEVVRDPVVLTIPADVQASSLEAWVGLFSGAERMGVSRPGPLGRDGEDRALAARLPVSCE